MSVRSMKQSRGRPLVDQLSFNLAEHFLQDERHTEEESWDLADVIQQAVEGWFVMRESITERRVRFHEILREIAVETDQADFEVMWYAKRNPGVCCSNAPRGEPILFGGRRQP